MAFYGIMAAVIVVCSFSLAGKSIKIPVKYITFFILLFVSVIFFVHICTTFYMLREDNLSYIEFSRYVSYIYNYYDKSMGVPTFGGVVFGTIVYGLAAALTIYGALILILALMVVSVIFVGDFFYSYFTGKLTLNSKRTVEIEPSVQTSTIPSIGGVDRGDTRKRAFDILFNEETYPEQVSTMPSSERIDVSPQSGLDNPGYGRSQAVEILFGGNVSNPEPQQTTTKNDFFQKSETENDEFILRGYYKPAEEAKPQQESKFDWKVATPVEPVKEEPPVTVETVEQTAVNTMASETVTSTQPDIVDIVTPAQDKIEESQSFVREIIVPDEDEPILAEQVVEPVPAVEPDEEKDDEEILAIPSEKVIETTEGRAVQEGLDFISRGELKKEQERVHKFIPYNQPPFELLTDATIVDDFEADDRQRSADAIVNKLSVFGIKVEPSNIIVGPSVTRYMFNVLSQKTRMSEFARFSDDIKACIEAQDDIRIEAPVHGTNQVGIEVANKVKTPVVLRSLLESETFQKAKGKLVFAIGQEITGKVIVADLADMPHLLIAGTTGSGKSVCLNCMIVSLMYKYGPEYVRFVMVDPKFVELSRYNGIPHMLTSETITNTNDALAGLDYLINEMEARYQLFRSSGVGNISEYNSRVNTNISQRLPYLVFIVDELADLMAASKQAFESKLQRLAQKSRAAGIHIVLATQRPDVKTITGTIKANLPCRMALKVASIFDSNTIIGGGGAEKLLGKGDMLFMDSGSPDLERVQGAYVSNDEIRALVEFSREANEVYYDDKVSDEIFISRKQAAEAAAEQEREKEGPKEAQLDPLCKKALHFWLEKQAGRASIASIQRNLGIGFNRAGRIMDSLQKLKYVEELSPSDPSSKPLKVLVTLEELDDLFPDQED
ncbi:MAG: DNA translocase FtsK [Clostridiales bacterium]|nr:DNA translocase FtsK [Clostridiales bacterium]